jgi:hypothetical protein
VSNITFLTTTGLTFDISLRGPRTILCGNSSALKSYFGECLLAEFTSNNKKAPVDSVIYFSGMLSGTYRNADAVTSIIYTATNSLIFLDDFDSTLAYHATVTHDSAKIIDALYNTDNQFIIVSRDSSWSQDKISNISELNYIQETNVVQNVFIWDTPLKVTKHD